VPIRGGDSVDLVDVTAGKVVKNLPVKVPHNCYNAQRNDHVWVTSMGDHKVNLIDLKTLKYIAEVPVGGTPRPLAVTRDEKTLYCQLSDLQGERIKTSPGSWLRLAFPRENRGPEPPPCACGRCCLSADGA
jgi:YVTN family beta-propeller protein